MKISMLETKNQYSLLYDMYSHFQSVYYHKKDLFSDPLLNKNNFISHVNSIGIEYLIAWNLKPRQICLQKQELTVQPCMIVSLGATVLVMILKKWSDNYQEISGVQSIKSRIVLGGRYMLLLGWRGRFPVEAIFSRVVHCISLLIFN